MNSPMIRRVAQKAAYFTELSDRLLAGLPQASQVGVMAARQTRAPACNSIRYPSPDGWSVCVPCGSPAFLFFRRELAEGRAVETGALSFPQKEMHTLEKAFSSREQNQCTDSQLLSLPVARHSRSPRAATRWANRPSMVRARGLRPRRCLTATLQPGLSSAPAQMSSIASKTRASATNLTFPTRHGGPMTETKPSTPLGARWLFCCQMSAGLPAGQEPEGT